MKDDNSTVVQITVAELKTIVQDAVNNHLPVERILDVNETAKIVGLSPRTLNGMRADGSGPKYIKISPRRVGYHPDDIKQYLAALPRL